MNEEAITHLTFSFACHRFLGLQRLFALDVAAGEVSNIDVDGVTIAILVFFDTIVNVTLRGKEPVLSFLVSACFELLLEFLFAIFT